MALPYWSEDDLKDRLSEEVVLNCLDDNNDGVVDQGPLSRLQADCDSYIEGTLRPIYDIDVVRESPPNQVVRLSLDRAIVELAKRHPEYVRRDWEPLDNALERELDAIRSGRKRLDTKLAPEPPANTGGTLLSPGGSTSGLICAPKPIFGGPSGMGDF